jgi:putative endopeptidase
MAMAACGRQQAKAPALDLSDLDTTVSPKADFYKYATGGWQAKNPLRPEFSRFGSFDVIAETNQKQLNELFESMMTMKAEKGTVDQKISDLYKMALDSVTRNALGAEPIKPYITEIQAVGSKEELAVLLGKMNLVGEGGFYSSGVAADLMDSDSQVLYMGQGGLGMGDRDYYLLDKNAALKDGYKAFLVKVLTLAGVEGPETVVEQDMAVEDAMAQAFWTREQTRDVAASYNPMSCAEMFSRWPSLMLDKTLAAAGIPEQDKVIVEQPSYFDALAKIFSVARSLKQFKRNNKISLTLINDRRINLVAVTNISNNRTAALAHSVNLANLYIVACIKQNLSQSFRRKQGTLSAYANYHYIFYHYNAPNLHICEQTPQPTQSVASILAFPPFIEIAGQPIFIHILQLLHLS